MTPVAWVALYIAATAIGELASPLLNSRFPLNLAHGKPGDTRSTLFRRFLVAYILFVGISGMLGGCLAMAVTLLLSHR